MDTFPLLLVLALVLAIGLALGALIGVLWSRSRPADDPAIAALQQRGRRVLRLHLADPEAGLARLEAMMHAMLGEPARA